MLLLHNDIDSLSQALEWRHLESVSIQIDSHPLLYDSELRNSEHRVVVVFSNT